MNMWFLIVAMSAVTYLIRFSLFAWPSLRFPPLVVRALNYVPTAVLTAIIVPGMLMPDGSTLQLGLGNAYLLAGLGCIGIAIWRKRLLATIGGGLLLFFVLRWSMGQLPL